MFSTAQYSDIELNQARLISKLSGRPAHIRDDVFVWNGSIIDRACAVVALLKVYSSLPVTSSAKEKLCKSYYEKFQNANSDFIIDQEKSEWNNDIWFYKICKRIKGEINERTESDIKEILIYLHTT
jgi:hypothetical protein